MPWEFLEGVPLYTQIVDHFRKEIACGRYQPGEKLLSVRDLAAQAAVNPNTMQKALGELEREGLVYTQRTNGRFITEDEARMRQIREELATEQIRLLFNSLKQIGYTTEQILQAVTSAAKEREQ